MMSASLSFFTKKSPLFSIVININEKRILKEVKEMIKFLNQMA